MSTPVCKLLGIEHPIVQAPMAAIPELAAAVSNAGALGMFTLTWSPDPAAVVRETAALTSKPFGGNFILREDHHQHVDQALEAGLRILSFMWGDPASYVEPVHAAGGIVMHTVGSAEEARKAVASGVDVIVAQGWEAGGHVWGSVATLPLVPAVVDAAAPVPVIAAGGIGDARGVAAVFALGAQAAWLGTRFLLADEMPIHDYYRRRLINANETDPRWYPDLYEVGWPDSPHRALRNTTAEEWDAAGRPAAGQRPGDGDVIAHFASGEEIVRYEPAPPMVGTTGDIEALSMWAGQDVALMRESRPAADIVSELVSRIQREAEALASRSGRGLDGGERRTVGEAGQQVAIVTGGSQGIGAGLVQGYRQRGWAVVANALHIKPSDDPDVLTVQGDISQQATAQQVMSQAMTQFGQVDTLINDAGVFVAKPFTDYTAQDFELITGVNLAGFFWLTQLAIGQMLQQGGGHVVNISASIADVADLAEPTALTALTKGGLAAVTRSLAAEYASRGIRVNAVAPGIIQTPLHPPESYSPEALGGMLAPLGHVGQVSDIVDGILYLESARFVTGEILHIDGGRTAGR